MSVSSLFGVLRAEQLAQLAAGAAPGSAQVEDRDAPVRIVVDGRHGVALDVFDGRLEGLAAARVLGSDPVLDAVLVVEVEQGRVAGPPPLRRELHLLGLLGFVEDVYEARVVGVEVEAAVFIGPRQEEALAGDEGVFMHVVGLDLDVGGRAQLSELVGGGAPPRAFLLDGEALERQAFQRRVDDHAAPVLHPARLDLAEQVAEMLGRVDQRLRTLVVGVEQVVARPLLGERVVSALGVTLRGCHAASSVVLASVLRRRAPQRRTRLDAPQDKLAHQPDQGVYAVR